MIAPAPVSVEYPNSDTVVIRVPRPGDGASSLQARSYWFLMCCVPALGQLRGLARHGLLGLPTCRHRTHSFIWCWLKQHNYFMFCQSICV